jgi:hypothetical protein
MDIYYVEAASMPTDQGIGRHYERDWIHGWVGGYSNNPVAVGHYFYQIWKALPTPSTPIYGVGLDATHSIANTSFVPFQMLPPDYMMDVNYTVSAKYTNATGTPDIIYITLGLYRANYYTGEITYLDVGTFSIENGTTITQILTWTTDDTSADGLYVIGFRVEPIGAPGAEVYPASTLLLASNSTGRWVYAGTPPYPSVTGDLGSRVGTTNRFFVTDGVVTSADTSLYLLCVKGVGPNGVKTPLQWP